MLKLITLGTLAISQQFSQVFSYKHTITYLKHMKLQILLPR